MNTRPWHYDFRSPSIEHLGSIRVVFIEETPTVEGVRCFIQEIYEQRLLEATHLFMAREDLTEMSKNFIRGPEGNSLHILRYFSDSDDLRYASWGNPIKRIFHANGVTRVIALPDLEHRVAIAGFFER